MNRLFRKYHRWLAIVFALPLLTTILMGITFPIARSFNQRQLAGLLIHIHTLEIFGLETIFPIINGVGLLGLLITGIYMTSLFRQRRPST
jgi:hypothetical protein